jgi:hypothetical protein
MDRAAVTLKNVYLRAAITCPPPLRLEGGLLVDVGDHILERRVFNADVGHRCGTQDLVHHGFNRCEARVHLEFHGVTRAFEDSDARKLERGRFGVEFHVQNLGSQIRAAHSADLVVQHDPPVIDDDHAFGDVFDVSGIVAGQKDRQAVRAVPFADQIAQFLTGDHVQANGGFVQEQHAGFVQQTGGDLGAHALPEGQLPDRCLEEFLQPETLDQFVAALCVLGFGQVVNAAQQFKRVTWWQVIPQL